LGYSDGTVIPNLPLPIEGWNTENGYPSGGSSYYGPVTLRTAVVQSLNSATAWTLLNLVGLDTSYNYLTYMGVNPSHISKTASGLALGDSGITPIELAGAYATIANSGVYQEPLSFTKVEDRDGNIILNADDIRNERKVFEPSTAYTVADMLVNAVQSGTGKRAQIDGVTVGGKTGTVQNATGVLFAGITPDYTATLWVGSDEYKPLASDVYSSTSAAPLWQYIMSTIYETGEASNKYPNKGGPIINADPTQFGLVQREVCSVSGLLATDACRADTSHKPVMAWFVSGKEPTEECNVHALLQVCNASSMLAGFYCPRENVVQQLVYFLDADSPYWKLSAEDRAKYLGQRVFVRPDTPVELLTPDLPGYYDYYCNIHTKDWYDSYVLLQSAIEAAQAQIADSNALLANSALSIPMADRTTLSGMISDLQALIASDTATAGAIEQKTQALKAYTDQLETLYSNPQP
jgi:penicillin-binding protein 1A